MQNGSWIVQQIRASDEINLICLMYPDLSVALSIEDSVSVKGLCVRCGWCVSAFWMLCEGCIAAVAFSHIVSGAIMLVSSSLLKCSMS
jgi:hypothetical protein